MWREKQEERGESEKIPRFWRTESHWEINTKIKGGEKRARILLNFPQDYINGWSVCTSPQKFQKAHHMLFVIYVEVKQGYCQNVDTKGSGNQQIQFETTCQHNVTATTSVCFSPKNMKCHVFVSTLLLLVAICWTTHADTKTQEAFTWKCTFITFHHYLQTFFFFTNTTFKPFTHQII